MTPPIGKPIALVTGATSGFGLAVTLWLAEKNYRVYATYRNVKKMEKMKKQVKNLDVHGVPMEVTQTKSVQQAVRKVIQNEKRIDVLINNAGFAMGGFLEDLTDQDLKDQFETNVFGYLRVIREVVPVMRKRQSGKIINIGSISGRVAFPALGAYVASKFSVRALSEALRQELRPDGIEVAEMVPGAYLTEITTSARYGKHVKKPYSPYREYTLQMEKLMSKEFAKGGPASEVAQLIGKALRDTPMKPLYWAGRDAQCMGFLKWFLPDFIFEGLLKLMIPWSRFPR